MSIPRCPILTLHQYSRVDYRLVKHAEKNSDGPSISSCYCAVMAQLIKAICPALCLIIRKNRVRLRTSDFCRMRIRRSNQNYLVFFFGICESSVISRVWQNFVSDGFLEVTLNLAGICRLFFLIVPVIVSLYIGWSMRSINGIDVNQLSIVTVGPVLCIGTVTSRK